MTAIFILREDNMKLSSLLSTTVCIVYCVTCEKRFSLQTACATVPLFQKHALLSQV